VFVIAVCCCFSLALTGITGRSSEVRATADDTQATADDTQATADDTQAMADDTVISSLTKGKRCSKCSKYVWERR